jgi:hypothetical protein
MIERVFCRFVAWQQFEPKAWTRSMVVAGFPSAVGRARRKFKLAHAQRMRIGSSKLRVIAPSSCPSTPPPSGRQPDGSTDRGTEDDDAHLADG